MKTKSFVPPSGSRIVSFHPNGQAQSKKSIKMQAKRAARRSTKISQDEKQEQLQQLDADWETILCRKTLTPNTLKRVFRVSWPDVHAEMDISELIAARMSVVVTLTDIFGEQHIGFYKDADSACKALSAAITTLQSFFTSSEDQQHNLIISQYVFAITYMESAIELLTCKMLAPTAHENFQRGCGQILLRIHSAPYWKNIEKMISREIQEVEALVVIGDMLIGGFRGGKWEFVRGILVTVGVFGSAKGGGNTGRACLLTKADFLKRIGPEGKDADICVNESRALMASALCFVLIFPRLIFFKLRQNYYGPLASNESIEACGAPPDGDRGLGAPPLHTSKSNLVLRSFNKHLQICPTSSCTGSNAIPLGNVPSKGLKRLREQENKCYRETSEYGDSDSSADEGEVGGINRGHESWKRPKLNPDMRLLAEPEPGPSSQETPAMRRVRIEIEGVRIWDEGVVAELPEIVSEKNAGTNAGKTDREEQLL